MRFSTRDGRLTVLVFFPNRRNLHSIYNSIINTFIFKKITTSQNIGWLYFYILEPLAVVGDWTFYKKRVSGNMTKENIIRTCEEANLTTTCSVSPSCPGSDAGCNVTSLDSCDFPMTELSKALCDKAMPYDCSALMDVFAYYNIPSYPSGAISAASAPRRWIDGSFYKNQYALCAEKEDLIKRKFALMIQSTANIID